MNEEILLPEEELLHAAADCPALSAGLKNRVIEAAFIAQRSQIRRQRVLGGACILVAILGVTMWNRGTPSRQSVGEAFSARELVSERLRIHRHEAVLDDRDLRRDPEEEMVVVNGSDEWSLVEEGLRFRKTRSVALLSVFN